MMIILLLMESAPDAKVVKYMKKMIKIILKWISVDLVHLKLVIVGIVEKKRVMEIKQFVINVKKALIFLMIKVSAKVV